MPRRFGRREDSVSVLYNALFSVYQFIDTCEEILTLHPPFWGNGHSWLLFISHAHIIDFPLSIYRTLMKSTEKNIYIMK